MFTFAVSIDDLTAAVLDFPPRIKAKEQLVLKAGWRRWGVLALEVFVLALFWGFFVSRLDAAWAVGDALAAVGVLALLRWCRLDHSVRRQLPRAVEREARNLLASRGDRRRVGADVTGLTVGDAVFTQHLPWSRVQLVETDRHVILGSDASSVAIPRHIGQPLLDLVRFARICGVS